MVKLFVAEDANAPDDSRVRSKEAWGENRIVRHGARQVSVNYTINDKKE